MKQSWVHRVLVSDTTMIVLLVVWAVVGALWLLRDCGGPNQWAGFANNY